MGGPEKSHCKSVDKDGMGDVIKKVYGFINSQIIRKMMKPVIHEGVEEFDCEKNKRNYMQVHATKETVITL